MLFRSEATEPSQERKITTAVGKAKRPKGMQRISEMKKICAILAMMVSGGELRAEVMANYLRHEHLPDGTFLSENARYQQTYGMLSEEGVIIQQSYNKSQAASFLAA